MCYLLYLYTEFCIVLVSMTGTSCKAKMPISISIASANLVVPKEITDDKYKMLQNNGSFEIDITAGRQRSLENALVHKKVHFSPNNYCLLGTLVLQYLSFAVFFLTFSILHGGAMSCGKTILSRRLKSKFSKLGCSIANAHANMKLGHTPNQSFSTRIKASLYASGILINRNYCGFTISLCTCLISRLLGILWKKNKRCPLLM